MPPEIVRTTARLSKGWRTGLQWLFVGTLVMVWLPAALTQTWIEGAAVTVIVALMFLPIVRMRVDMQAGHDGIRARWGPWVRLRFAAEEIIDVRPVNPRGGIQDGMGLRHPGERAWGLLVGGPAVQVDLRDGRRWVLSTPLPDDIVAAVATAAR